VSPPEVGLALDSHRDHTLVEALVQLLGGPRWGVDDLRDTSVTQPCVYVAGLVLADGAFDPADAVVAVGHSLGELTALAWAGGLDPLHGLELVAARAALGREQAERRPGSMIAVMKVPLPDVEWFRRRAVAETGGVLEQAVWNGGSQVVLSGDADAAQAVVDLVREHTEDGVARPLPIGGPFHSPRMWDAVHPFRDAVLAAGPQPTRVPVVSSSACRVVGDAEDVASVLARSLVLPVRWPDAVDAVVAQGATRGVDIGPGKTLANLSRFVPALPITPLADLP
jgi:[acyl-carrier-protein] S-malonyltransferase